MQTTIATVTHAAKFRRGRAAQGARLPRRPVAMPSTASRAMAEAAPGQAPAAATTTRSVGGVGQASPGVEAPHRVASRPLLPAVAVMGEARLAERGLGGTGARTRSEAAAGAAGWSVVGAVLGPMARVRLGLGVGVCAALMDWDCEHNAGRQGRSAVPVGPDTKG